MLFLKAIIGTLFISSSALADGEYNCHSFFLWKQLAGRMVLNLQRDVSAEEIDPEIRARFNHLALDIRVGARDNVIPLPYRMDLPDVKKVIQDLKRQKFFTDRVGDNAEIFKIEAIVNNFKNGDVSDNGGLLWHSDGYVSATQMIEGKLSVGDFSEHTFILQITAPDEENPAPTLFLKNIASGMAVPDFFYRLVENGSVALITQQAPSNRWTHLHPLLIHRRQVAAFAGRRIFIRVRARKIK